VQAAENAGLVVFGWVEVGDDHIVRVREGDMAGRAVGSLAFALTGELPTVGAVNAEDMATCDSQQTQETKAQRSFEAYLQVVTTAWSLSSLRHLSTLHRSVCSIVMI
jgi:hypothetical protein